MNLQMNLEKRFIIYQKIKKKFKSFSVTIMHDYVSEYEFPYNLRFIDSNKFLMRSLDTHVINLSELQSCNCSDKSK